MLSKCWFIISYPITWTLSFLLQQGQARCITRWRQVLQAWTGSDLPASHPWGLLWKQSSGTGLTLNMFVLFPHLAPSTLASRILPSWQDTGKPSFRYLKSKCLYSVFSQQTAESSFPTLNLISMLSGSTQSFQFFFNLPMYYEHTAKFYIRASN